MHRWDGKAFEAPGVEPVFSQKNQAIYYAQNRACFRSRGFENMARRVPVIADLVLNYVAVIRY